jgi:hypothetical protein
MDGWMDALMHQWKGWDGMGWIGWDGIGWMDRCIDESTYGINGVGLDTIDWMEWDDNDGMRWIDGLMHG